MKIRFNDLCSSSSMYVPRKKMWIGAAIGAVGSIAGGIAQAKMMGKVADNIKQQQKENQDWYDRRYNEDATQRADAQRLLTMTEDALKKRNKAAAGTAAVMGSTNETVAAEKAASTQALADTMGNINAQAENRKSQIESQYLSTKNSLNDKLNDLYTQRAQAVGQAIQGVGQAAGSLPL